MKPLTILDLYPNHLNVNGDSGNILAMTRRLEWAGIASRVIQAEVGEIWWQDTPDIVHIGGGTIAAQQAVLDVLVAARSALSDWASDGVSILGVSGGFHLLLDEIQFAEDEVAVPGLGLLGGKSVPTGTRISEYMVARTATGLIYGYQNSGQLAELSATTTAWAQVVAGAGNSAPVATEGAIHGAVLGTNLNGPLLPRNPLIADALLTRATSRAGLEYRTGPQHAHADAVAHQASAVIRGRLGVKDEQ